MGIPEHYSRDLPARCLHLIEQLLPTASRVRVKREEHLGPLTTTFLLAMSTPIITLPIERVEGHRRKEAVGLEGYSDDRLLDPDLTRTIDEDLGENPVARSPFYRHGAWRFASIEYVVGQNIARELPPELTAALNLDGAVDDAGSLSGVHWSRCLRNALAHGGIAYLDADGRQSIGRPTEMIAFVSAQYPKGGMRHPPSSLQVLRITRDDYLDFLRRWVHWLDSSHLSIAMAA